MADPMEVKLVPLVAMEDSPVGPAPVEHGIYLVYVHSVALAHRNKDCKLQVGTIGKHAGAGFCGIPELDNFTYAQQQWIAEEAKRLHGSASQRAYVHPPLNVIESDEEEASEDDE